MKNGESSCEDINKTERRGYAVVLQMTVMWSLNQSCWLLFYIFLADILFLSWGISGLGYSFCSRTFISISTVTAIKFFFNRVLAPHVASYKKIFHKLLLLKAYRFKSIDRYFNPIFQRLQMSSKLNVNPD